jgi:tetratricopeptide (TPR) repeat protein
MVRRDVVTAGHLVGGRYRLVAPVGRGSAGAVWQAVDTTDGKAVAVKVIVAGDDPATDVRLGRFLREAAAMARLSAPHIVAIRDHGTGAVGAERVAYLVMELLAGESLREHLDRTGSLEPHAAAAIVTQVGGAIGFAHERGIVHRDLKPSNVFVCEQSGTDRCCKVLDFGLTKSFGAPLVASDPVHTDVGLAIGTPYYMSPEQASGLGSVDHRTDLWALGVIAFECICGRRPFDARSLREVMARILEGEPPVPSTIASVPPGFDGWFARAVTRDVQERFQSAREMVEALHETFGTEPPRSSESSIADSLHTRIAPALGSEERTSRRLPGDVVLVGRGAELGAVDRAVANHFRVVTLIGARGVGRAAIARAWAAVHRPSFPGGLWRCSLEHATDADAMWLALGAMLEARIGPSDAAVGVGRALACLGPAVVLVEQADRVRGQLAAALSRVLPAAPQCVFLVTSNRALGAPSERVVGVPPFDTPPSLELLALLGAREADLLARAGGGTALALELLAASGRDAAQRALGAIVASGDPDAPLENVVGACIDALDEQARDALVRCASFRGGFDAEAAAAVLGCGDAVLDRLVARRLLRRDERRFSLHPMVRKVCSRLLAEAGVETTRATMERHARHYAALGLPRALEVLATDGDAALRRRYAAEHENLAAALKRARTAIDAPVAASCALALAALETSFGRHAGAASLLLSVDGLEGLDADERLRIAAARGQALAADGRLSVAERHLENALALPAGAAARAAALVTLAETQLARGRPERAGRSAMEAEALAGGSLALAVRAALVLARLDEEDAAPRLHGALLVARRLGARALVAAVLEQMGDEVRGALDEALLLHRQRGDRLGEARVLVALGDPASLDAAAALSREIGASEVEALALVALAASTPDRDRAVALVAQAERTLREHDARGSLALAEVLVCRAELLATTDARAARVAIAAAEAVFADLERAPSPALRRRLAQAAAAAVDP